ncbi:protein phosphatase regulator [Botrytis cinerea]
MPYTPPSHRSPATSTTHSPAVSRRSSYQLNHPTPSPRPELPRSTSYLTRHRHGEKGPSHDTNSSLIASSSLRKSPPPVTDETKMPIGVVMSPPDSTQNSDEEDNGLRGRKLENLEELQAAIRVIEQHRESSPKRASSEIQRLTQAISLLPIKDAKELKDKPTSEHIETSQPPRKLQHQRSSTETVFLDFRNNANNQSAPETPTTGSDDEMSEDEEAMIRRKPQMLRKKSGELVRPALRPSSARRRPSSMPGTPTFSKAVHFDSHLEHVRHFLQVDRPLASFHAIRVERVFLSADNKNLIGTVAVTNLAFNKMVVARFTLDYWKTTSEVVAEYNNDIRQPKHGDGCDRFNFNIKLADQANLEAKTMFFCVKYCVNGVEYWDNNNSTNFQIDFRKKAKAQNGKRGSPGAASRSANSLPRSNKKSPPATAKKTATFDDFSNDFDSKYLNTNFKLPVADYLGDSNTVRLKGVKSAVTLTSDNRSRRAASMNTNAAGGQAFGHRYDFGASLNAAISAANSSLGDKSGITMKSKRPAPITETRKFIDHDEQVSPLSMSAPKTFNNITPPKTLPSVKTNTSGTDSPRPVGTEKPVLASQSYNELLDKYCFFGSVKNSPQLKDGTARSGQYDGNNDDGYLFGSAESTASNSPITMAHIDTRPSPHQSGVSPQGTRSTSPAPMTGFVSGTSSMYPYHMHGGFSFNDAHAATAIRG